MHTTLETERDRLRKRIRRFYDLFARGEWQKCYDLLDPGLRDGTVKFDQYARSLEEFRRYFGPITVTRVEELNVGKSAKRNGGEDGRVGYAVVLWHGKDNERRLLRERWVMTGGNWYSRRAGLIVPDWAKSA